MPLGSAATAGLMNSIPTIVKTVDNIKNKIEAVREENVVKNKPTVDYAYALDKIKSRRSKS